MDLGGAGVVITGAGHGIGRALAARLAAEGAKVVVNDLDAHAAATVADDIGGYAVAGDAATEAGVEALIKTARAHLGTIDIYVANAGIISGAGLDATEDEWARAIDVNLLAHVRAAKALVPQWLAAGGGRFVVTASAAGLLTALGSAPYSVTKHGAVAFAEWLSATYGHRGVSVHCVCPQGVQTAMLDSASPVIQAVLSHDGALTPQQVADAVVAGMAAGKFLILPHPEVHEYYQHRAADTDRWLGGMRKLQRVIDQAEG